MQDNSDLIIRDCCEAEVAEFGQPDTICITVDVLREIVQRHFPGPCLHQIQEPAAAEQAAWHAGLDEGRAQAAPAAVAVPDALRDAEKLLRAEAARLDRLYGMNKWYGFCAEKASRLEHLRVADALAATPAADAPAVPKWIDDPHDIEQGQMLNPEWVKQQDAAAAPVVLPPPDLWRDAEGLRGYAADPGNGPWYTAETVLALLATATGLPAQATEATHADFEAWWEAAGDGRSKMLAKRAWTAATRAAAPQAQADAQDALTPAARDVLAERQRQISAEGWTPERDDEYRPGELLMAADAYISWNCGEYEPGTVPINWPWKLDWFKPTTERRNLEKAGALILAEIERIDRAAIAAAKGE